MSIGLSIVLGISIPALFLYIIWSLEIYALGELKLLLTALGWGAIAFVLALVIQNGLLKAGILSFNQITFITAPILEELLKAGIIIWLAARMKLHYAVDGTIYGFAIGTAFAIGENLLYIRLSSDQAFDVTLARLLSSSLMHSFNTAIVGTVAGSSIYFAYPSRARRIALSLAGVMLIHAIFNQIANTQQGLLLLILGITIGLGGTGILVILISRYLNIEGKSIERQLSSQMGQGEIAAVLNPQQIATTLLQHQGEIGQKRAKILQEYVVLQAQQAVIKKNLLLNQRPKFSKALKLQLDATDQRLGSLRSTMGLYTWVWLRTIVPSEESELWEQLGSEVNADQSVLTLVVELNKRQTEVAATDLIVRKAILKETRLFSDLSDEDMEDLALLLRERTYDLGDEVIKQGAVDDQLYVVASGSLVVSATNNEGMEAIVTSYYPGDSFGELSMFDMEPYPASVACLDTVKIYTLARADLFTLLYAKPQVGIRMMRYLIDQIRRGTSLLMWIQQGNSPQS